MFGDWEGFFETMSVVSVTAFTVLFITLQVKSHMWTSSRLKTWAAVAALTELFVPLITSLISLMPAHPWRIAAWITGGCGLMVIVAHWGLYRHDRAIADRFDRIQAVSGGCVSLPVYGAIVVAGFSPATVGLYLLGGLSIWLLFSGVTEAWVLLEPRGISPTLDDQADGHAVEKSSAPV